MPSPTGIYTYGPALSLHVALPISGGGHADGIGLGVIAVDEGADGEFGRDTAALCASHSIGDGGHRAMAGKFASAGKVDARIILVRGRSEEHTSELQSLMRNSYADFGSKKKKTLTITANSQQ